MNNRELTHNWANQRMESGKGSNMFFEGTKIYSYGRHFLIAQIIPDKNVVLFTSDGYSTTTAKHKSFTRSAIHQKIFITPGAELNHSRNLDYYVESFNNEIEAAATKRNKEDYLQAAQTWLTTMRDYLQTFELNAKRFKGVTQIISRKDNILPADLEQKLKARKLAERQRILEEKKESIAEWLKGSRDFLPHNIKDIFLRVVDNKEGKFVQSSKSAKVNYEAAKILYKLIKKGKDIKGYNLDGYTVIGINGTLKIGCHEIDTKEVERFAKSQNWQPNESLHHLR